MIISGFAGIGKTTVSKLNRNSIDLESSDFHWIYKTNVQNLERNGI